MFTVCKFTNPLISPCRHLINLPSRTYYKKPFFYEDKYFGKFDYHDRQKYPRRLSPVKEEELLSEINDIKEREVVPSPFHVIRRVRGFKDERIQWPEQVTLRRLDLHSYRNGDVTIVPNTPQYNELINRVKHLIQLKPALFADGSVPTEEDIGALKVCPYTGVVQKDEKLRMRASRLNLEKPLLFRGNHLRFKLARLYGLNNKHYAR